MTEQSPFRLKGRNPDVLSCIANLSNDEVFTPPEFANRILDTLTEAWAEDNDGENIWENSAVTFLDPCTKSGVFLREIAKRLINGLADEIPDLQERVNHILTQQVYGIGITQITALLARRSLYCSKSATGEHSVATEFNDADGNIWFERTEHKWENNKCTYCGASADTLDRGENSESHAYAFIHTDNIQDRVVEIFGDDMQFDVVIGNPPYQISLDEGGQNVKPIYNLFVEQAKLLAPKKIVMVTPSRWMAGGRHLDEYRASMLSDRRLTNIVDFPNAADVFPSVGINGGVSYFLWSSSADGDCSVTTIKGEDTYGPHNRKLDKFDVFIRDTRAVKILEKVQDLKEGIFSEIVSSRDPFGSILSSNFKDYHSNKQDGDVLVYFNEKGKRRTAWTSANNATRNQNLIPHWKVLIPKAGSGRERERSGVDLVLSSPLIAEPFSLCTITYLVAGPLSSELEARSVASYISTKFFRFLVSLRKISQNAARGVYSFVPIQNWDRIWTDQELYDKYDITEDEVTFIEDLIRPMELDLFDTPMSDKS